ncbi:MAG TPA: TadE/TadG family type IV pilus assembly protein [Bradyrhizobium sp.]|uniref:TadE/TadG family type IV pilus assembly protein n=1 Tax=Bradyrhizobium sp. TaxID=376 RepID=UPI002BA5268D|nr:TadE/TadG family type IV pilus assembly protein [Bradyrhizobium sp.]HLZ04275.1 TadE/TadG family type IV pilus assembly protein [Bradyrhizobium sp.]
MKAIISGRMRSRRRFTDLLGDCRGLAATEFAIILPIMLLAFFGTVEFCSAVAIDRKVTLTARTLSDLTSQQSSTANSNTYNNVAVIADPDLQNNFDASIGIMAGYDPSPEKLTLSEIYVDSTGVAKIQWSKAAIIGKGASQSTMVTSPRNAGDDVTSVVPTQLLVKKTYLIFSEVSYQYVPTIGYVLKNSVTLNDVSYTRPRQALCITYNLQPQLTNPGNACPQT